MFKGPHVSNVFSDITSGRAHLDVWWIDKPTSCCYSLGKQGDWSIQHTSMTYVNTKFPENKTVTFDCAMQIHVLSGLAKHIHFFIVASWFLKSMWLSCQASHFRERPWKRWICVTVYNIRGGMMEAAYKIELLWSIRSPQTFQQQEPVWFPTILHGPAGQEVFVDISI